MTPHTDNVVERPTDLTAAWLTAAIGAGDITDFTVERIGTGQMSECYRVQLSYADTAPRSDRPGSVVLKVAATDPASRETGASAAVQLAGARLLCSGDAHRIHRGGPDGLPCAPTLSAPATRSRPGMHAGSSRVRWSASGHGGKA